MKFPRLMALGLCGWLAAVSSSVQADTRFSIGLNFGAPYPRPWCPPCHHHHGLYIYRPYPVYVERPVVVRPVPVVVEEPAVAVQRPHPTQSYQPPPPTPSPYQPVSTAPPPLAADVHQAADVAQYLQLLNDPDERIRSDAAIRLGRLKADRAVDPLAATVAGDSSPVVREAAARALGLIGAPRALAALSHAAQADQDRDVRRSAQFAVDVIQTSRQR